jgi:homopolymeric O-antigen transport system permease protein
MTSVAEYRASRELFVNLTLRELRSKYKRSFLGWAWSTLNPLATMIVYTIVFSVFFKAGSSTIGNPSGLHVYALSLMCALLPWNFFNGCVFGGIGSIIGNGSLIKKTYFPRQLLPAAAAGATLVSHLIEMGLLLVALLAFGNWRAAAFTPMVLLLTLITAVFGIGMGLLFSSLNVYFRDVEHFLAIVFLVWFYLTPIIYPIGIVPARFQQIIKLNPMTDMALSYRAAWYNGTWPGALELGYYALWAVCVFVVGWLVFNRLEAGLAEEL